MSMSMRRTSSKSKCKGSYKYWPFELEAEDWDKFCA